MARDSMGCSLAERKRMEIAEYRGPQQRLDTCQKCVHMGAYSPSSGRCLCALHNIYTRFHGVCKDHENRKAQDQRDSAGAPDTSAG